MAMVTLAVTVTPEATAILEATATLVAMATPVGMAIAAAMATLEATVARETTITGAAMATAMTAAATTPDRLGVTPTATTAIRAHLRPPAVMGAHLSPPFTSSQWAQPLSPRTRSLNSLLVRQLSFLAVRR